MYAKELITLATKGGEEAAVKGLNEANLTLLVNAHYHAKKGMNSTAAALFEKMIRERGGVLGKTPKEVDFKVYDTKINVTLNAANGLFNDLILSHAGKIGKLVSTEVQAKNTVYLFAFKKKDADMFKAKLADAKEVILADVQ